MNISLFNSLHSLAFQYAWLDAVIVFLAVPLIYIMVGVGGVFILKHYQIKNVKTAVEALRHKFKKIVSIPFTVGLAWLVADILKHIIHTDRPFIALANVQSLFFETGFAFPSGHSTAIAALAFAIYFKNKKWGYVFIVSALLIGLARVVAGVHFPIDILGGYALGFMVAFLSKTL